MQSTLANETVENIVTQAPPKGTSDLLRSSEDLDHIRVTGNGIFFQIFPLPTRNPKSSPSTTSP